MPVVAEVTGVQIAFYANEHPPPHFHGRIEHQAVVYIETRSVTEGFLPIAKRRAILAWTATWKAALRSAFVQATAHEKVEPIA